MLQAQTTPIRSLPRRLGRYTMLEPLAVGGMAELQLGRALDGRVVVVKEVAEPLRDGTRYSELLTAEALLTARMSHPNVVRVVGFGRGHEQGEPYVALEWVEGLDLRALLRTCTERKIALPIAHSLSIVAALLRALDHVHRARDERGVLLDVVHGDVSPANALIGFDGRVRLCDFGIARATSMPLLPRDVVIGKAGYMSPEHGAHDVDARADIYACGIVLWELLSGRRARKPGARIGDVPLLAVRGLPHESELHQIVYRAAARDRAERYQSASAMLRELERYQALSGLRSSETELSRWLAQTLPDRVAAAQALRTRMLEAPEMVDDAPRLSAPELDAIGVDVSGARRIVRPAKARPAKALARERRTKLVDRHDLFRAAARSCAVTLAVLALLVAVGAL